MSYLDHIISDRGVAVDPGKVNKIKSWPIPTTCHEVQQFLGLANYSIIDASSKVLLRLPSLCISSLNRTLLSSGPLNVTKHSLPCVLG